MDAKEVAKHNSRESCWVVINNVVYDVTDFLDSHPGGSKIILKLAGRDATAEYDPIHPPGTLEENLKPSQILGPLDPSTLPTPTSTAASTTPTPATSPLPPLEEQLNIDDFARTAETILAPKSWAYYSSASDDLHTKHHNNTAYRQILLRPRIFRDVEHVDTSTTLCGSPSRLPVFVAPAAMARLAHPTGEAGIASACGAHGVIQCVSNNASLRPEQICEARGSLDQPLWFQLYVQIERAKSEALLQRINKLGFTAIVLTLDAPAPGKREADERAKFDGERAVSGTSGEGGAGGAAKVKSEGLGRALFAGTSPSLTWEDLKWLRSQTHLPIILKGLQTHEDAAIAASRECRELGVTGIILSNHGGRGMDTAPPPVYTLLEIRKHVPEVLRRLEVYVDGGIRRGTDVVKALCLGAKAVGIGRPALYGLSGYGPEGVERVLTILREEIETAMRLLGVNRIEELGMQHINARALEGLIYMPEPDHHGFARAKL